MPGQTDALAGQCILMLAVALEELEVAKAEADLGKIRAKLLSVESTLKELIELAREAANTRD